MEKNYECALPIGYIYEDILNKFKGNQPDTYLAFDEIEHLNSNYPELVEVLKDSPVFSKYITETTFSLPKNVNGASAARCYIKAKL